MGEVMDALEAVNELLDREDGTDNDVNAWFESHSIDVEDAMHAVLHDAIAGERQQGVPRGVISTGILSGFILGVQMMARRPKPEPTLGRALRVMLDSMPEDEIRDHFEEELSALIEEDREPEGPPEPDPDSLHDRDR